MTEVIIVGPNAKAERITAKGKRPEQAATISAWLLTSPGWSPAWDHYLIGLCSLRDIDGVPPAHRQYPEAEYEILVAALDPRKHPKFDDAESLWPLTPINVAVQFHGLTDDQATRVLELVAEAAVDGVLIPEPEGIRGARDEWKRAIDATVDHFRRGLHG